MSASADRYWPDADVLGSTGKACSATIGVFHFAELDGRKLPFNV